MKYKTIDSSKIDSATNSIVKYFKSKGLKVERSQAQGALEWVILHCDINKVGEDDTEPQYIDAINAGRASKIITRVLKDKGVKVKDTQIREALARALDYTDVNVMYAYRKELLKE